MNQSHSKLLDYAPLLEKLRSRKQREALSWQQVADAAGVAATKITRLQDGKGLSVPVVVLLCDWAGLDINDLARADAPPWAISALDGLSAITPEAARRQLQIDREQIQISQK